MDCQLLASACHAQHATLLDLAAVGHGIAAAPPRVHHVPSGDSTLSPLRDAQGGRGEDFRRQCGNLTVALHHRAQTVSTHHQVSARGVLMLVALQGPLMVEAGSLSLVCPPGVPVLYADKGRVQATWPAQCRGLVIEVPREGVNAAASAALGDARRLAKSAFLAIEYAGNDQLDIVLGRLAALVTSSGGLPQADGLAIAAALHRNLAARLMGQEQRDALLPAVRSVSEAMRIVRADHRHDFDTESLAARVGVTAQTLRKGFRSCLGLSVKSFIQTVRLDWAHKTLCSALDGRPIDAIAKDAGFSGAPPFSRAFVGRFGEPPSMTRGRAVRAAPG